LESVTAPAGAEDGVEGEGFDGCEGDGAEGVEGDDEGSEEEGAEEAEVSFAVPLQPMIASAHVAERNRKNAFIARRQAFLGQTGIACNPGRPFKLKPVSAVHRPHVPGPADRSA